MTYETEVDIDVATSQQFVGGPNSHMEIASLHIYIFVFPQQSNNGPIPM